MTNGISSRAAMAATGTLDEQAADCGRGAFSIAEFAAWSGICRTLVYGEIKARRLKARRITRKRVVILREDAEAFMKSLPVVELAEAA